MNNIGADVSVTFTQEGDSINDGEQFLTVKIMDAGGGAYFVINTEGWAFDKPEELTEVLTNLMAKVKGLVEGDEIN